ncbi:hypothetical protein JCM14202_3369 [Agrilactobacillus composti DSM 18527 = JCM 14202]|uniref:hypothetical protein n=1 Tax=Agrilactobacillus composti TaxID=398555 RepID=UPI00042DF425|nr:hypothetical protein [Agrilactobacillus composti]GAF41430.1 hypothetical protein JCM14202_3369 [Agrilactobacillus composti DSM 18527 = JCM 14202]
MQNIKEKETLVNLPVENMINIMVDRSQEAFRTLKTFDQAKIDKICAAVADTARRHAKSLATLATKKPAGAMPMIKPLKTYTPANTSGTKSKMIKQLASLKTTKPTVFKKSLNL